MDITKDLKKLKAVADDTYFNSGSPIMTDLEYDILFGDSVEVGCLPQKDKVKLPIYMGSLTKCNDDKNIDNFLLKIPDVKFMVQEKLDGVSCLYTCDNGKIKLYTRGNGAWGTDVTHLLDYGLKCPKLQNEQIMVRGELISSKQSFEEYKDRFKNIRNMVSGQVNKKIPDRAIIEIIDFVSYEVIQPQKYQMKIKDQLTYLNSHNFKVVYNHIIKREFLKQKILAQYFIQRKQESQYEIDGLVVTTTDVYIRNGDGNPKYSFAFKLNSNMVQVEVKTVLWNLSKSGRYKPQIKIKPVTLAGATISSLTGFNAKYVFDNNICPGSILTITRSGDVIPHITGVVKSGPGKVVLPTNSKWDSVDLYHNFEIVPDEVKIKQMVYFFSSLKCLNCKDKTIFKIYNSGKQTIESIVQAKPEELAVIIGPKVASKVIESIRNSIRSASIQEVLAALNAFGDGISLKKIQLLDLDNPGKPVKGLSEVTIKEKILPNFKASIDRVMRLKHLVGYEEPLVLCSPEEGVLQGKTFVFTQFRDFKLESRIFELGGRVTTAISKKTTDLVVGGAKTSTKLTKALELGLNIITKDDLIKQLDKIV